MEHSTTLKNVLFRWAVLLIPATAIFLVDQLAKNWVMTHLDFGQSWIPIPALADFFAVTLSANKGAAFSMLPQFGDIFLIVAIGMIIGIFLFYRRMPPGHWIERFALGLVLGGVSGNALDRLQYGYVVDFFHIQLRPLLSNVSNFADHAIVIGIGILFITQWGVRPTEKANEKDRLATPAETSSDQPLS